jgi:glycosyltransferase involved in cell wall biosynthesis
MEKWKGHTLLLEALGRMKDMPDWVCWIVGGGQTKHENNYEDSLHQLAARLGLSDRVEFLGSLDDVGDLLAQAEIFCQPNLGAEPFGIVFIEALQSGIPVVSTRMGGAAEIVDDSCGVLVPAGEPLALANTLRSLVTDFNRRRQLGMAGPARATKLCDPARQLEKLREVLRSLS